MTVKELHELSISKIEWYIDRKTNTRFTLDYSENRNKDEWNIGIETYKANLEKKIESVRATVDSKGKAVLVIEYQ